ncbi:MAG: response regulator transcription factor [Pelomonas sp.]|nr:response regulator transcription factor [Roseateles sp.]
MKAVVVEDSRLAREGLVRMLAAFPEIEVVAQAEHAAEALPLIGAMRPQVLFLDVHMPGESGFALLEQLDYAPRVVFTTAHADEAIRSFDFNTVDYLLKPIRPERLAVAVGKLLGAAAAPDGAAPAEPLALTDRILLKDGERVHLVEVARIRCVESHGNYATLYFDAQRVALKRALTAIEARLPARQFARISRRHLINLAMVAKIDEALGDGYFVELDDGRRLPMSRRSAVQLHRRLGL